MSENEKKYCEDLLPYLIGELSSEQRKALERHLTECSQCREELSELQPVWDSIPLTMEEIVPPADLKDEVFTTLFPNESNELPALQKNRWKQLRSFGWGKVASILLVLLIGVSWNNIQLRGQLSGLQNESFSPVQVIESYTMVAADPGMKAASGNVWLLQNGDQKRLVVDMNGLAITKGDEVYQVWIIHDGQRQNAGTFRVDEHGKGVLTYHFTNPHIKIDKIGITLEPDPYGDQPRGKKVSGTS
jgi:hypothetical protein